MKKKISLILALALSASMLASCKKTDEESAGLPDAASTPSLTQMTMPEETEETSAPEKTAETEVTSASEEVSDATESESREETTTASESESETTTSASESVTTASATAETASKKDWSETEISETLYIKTACYSRTRAVVGSDSVKKYEAGTKINIVAATDTGYYKLADGTFIHSDYVTDEQPSSKTTTAKTEKTTEKTTTNNVDQPSGNPTKISSAYNRSYTDKYPYQQLSSSEKQLYANIVRAAENFETSVEVPSNLFSEDIFKVYCMVYNNEPQLFWLSSTVPSGYGTLNLSYALTSSQAASTQKTIDANVNDIMSKVGGYSSTISKLKVIYDWVILNNTFNREDTFETQGIYNGLTGNGALQCQGYAKTFMYLCDIAGIDCMVVNGQNSEGGSHAWNVVYCDNGYYIVDTTWGDPIADYAKSSYLSYVFFLANDSITKNTHFSVGIMTRGNGDRVKIYNPPSCTKSACYYFKAYNKEYSDLDSATAAMYAEFDAAVAAGKNVVQIKVTDQKMWDTLTSNSYAKDFQNYAKDKSSKVKELKRQRTLSKDALVVQYDIVYK